MAPTSARGRSASRVTVRLAQPPDLVPVEVVMPLDCALTAEEMTRALMALHAAKVYGCAEVTFTFHRVGDRVSMVNDRTLLKD